MQKLKVCEIVGHPIHIEYNGRFAILSVQTATSNVDINVVKNQEGELRSIRYLYGYTFKPKKSSGLPRLPERIPGTIFKLPEKQQKIEFEKLNLNKIFEIYKRNETIKFYTNAEHNALINFELDEKYRPKTIDLILNKLNKNTLLGNDWKIKEPIDPTTWRFTDYTPKDLDELLITGSELSRAVDSKAFFNGRGKFSNGRDFLEIDCGYLCKSGINISGKKRSFSHSDDIDTIMNFIKNSFIYMRKDLKEPNLVHPTIDLIEKALDELGKTKVSKNELITKLKEIVGRDGRVLVNDEIAWNEIQKLSDEEYK